eukprot:374150-Hanusia_phi.AAC.2
MSKRRARGEEDLAQVAERASTRDANQQRSANASDHSMQTLRGVEVQLGDDCSLACPSPRCRLPLHHLRALGTRLDRLRSGKGILPGWKGAGDVCWVLSWRMPGTGMKEVGDLALEGEVEGGRRASS